ncbi:MAG: TetR/AcrR family transcriptional regulator [Myxococcales bacterium]|nr:TetR/AcrR family transcriptional regulator [Myxococcales bacterium]MBK7195038.1 TetR/AcrR family transcriptional regulator [Myxococcales bacterium]MBP6842440.1 TetR/AcrR family transcriptional regulator [Kofleriaceae bacterium]
MARAALLPADIATTRERLATAATKLFARHGYDAVTMRAVAAELGVSAMTPYRYLGGKDELVALVRAQAFTRFAEALEAATAPARDPIARLQRLKAAYVGFAQAEPDAYRIMFELRAPGDEHRWPELTAATRRAFGCLLAAVTAAIDAGALTGEPLAVARLLWASTHGLCALYLSGNLPARSLARLAAVDHELAGFRPVAPAPARTRRRA